LPIKSRRLLSETVTTICTDSIARTV
jgi:hypothetical protein